MGLPLEERHPVEGKFRFDLEGWSQIPWRRERGAAKRGQSMQRAQRGQRHGAVPICDMLEKSTWVLSSKGHECKGRECWRPPGEDPSSIFPITVFVWGYLGRICCHFPLSSSHQFSRLCNYFWLNAILFFKQVKLKSSNPSLSFCPIY